MIKTHSDRESPIAFKLGESICKKILQQMPTPGSLVYSCSSGPNDSFGKPDPPFTPVSSQPNQLYSTMLADMFAEWASISDEMLNNIDVHSGKWNGSWSSVGNEGNGLQGQWSPGLPSMGGAWAVSGSGGINYSAWEILPTLFPGHYATPPYIYATGEPLAATENAAYGSFAEMQGGVVNVGNSRYTITQYQNTNTGSSPYSLGSVVKQIIGVTRGTTPLTYLDGNGNEWTVANGNGFVLIPMPEYNDNTVIIAPGWVPVGQDLLCDYNGNLKAQIGRINVLTILPPV